MVLLLGLKNHFEFRKRYQPIITNGRTIRLKFKIFNCLSLIHLIKNMNNFVSNLKNENKKMFKVKQYHEGGCLMQDLLKLLLL